MTTAFTNAVNNWHDFYIMVGTAAATLVGLLFVSLSLNADAVAHPQNSNLRAIAEQTFSTFIDILLFAILFLIPNQTPLGLGIPLLAIGCFGLYSTARHFLRSRSAEPRNLGRRLISRRFLAPTICFCVLIVISVSVLVGNVNGLYSLIPVMIILITGSSINAWDLLLRLRVPRAQDKTE